MTVKAIYENGVFRPLDPVQDLREHQEVQLSIVPQRTKGILIPAQVTGTAAEEILARLAGTLSAEEAAQMLRDVEDCRKIEGEW